MVRVMYSVSKAKPFMLITSFPVTCNGALHTSMDCYALALDTPPHSTHPSGPLTSSPSRLMQTSKQPGSAVVAARHSPRHNLRSQTTHSTAELCPMCSDIKKGQNWSIVAHTSMSNAAKTGYARSCMAKVSTAPSLDTTHPAVIGPLTSFLGLVPNLRIWGEFLSLNFPKHSSIEHACRPMFRKSTSKAKISRNSIT